MFDTTALDPRDPTEPEGEKFGGLLDPLEESELLELREAIQSRLPTTLQEINLENELVLQYKSAKTLLNKVLNDDNVQANQKAQVQNSCAASLKELARLQTDLFTAERLKAIEQMLIRAIRTLPQETQVQFFNEYEKLNSTTHRGTSHETP
jgi:hypothetical protein